MKIADVEIRSIKYHFYRDKFYSVVIAFQSEQDFEKIRDQFFNNYGFINPLSPKLRKFFIWESTNVKITLTYFIFNGTIIYTHCPIAELRERQKK